MTDDAQRIRCFQCGGPASQLNEDEEGIPCPACAERLLEELPGVFHEPWVPAEPREAENDAATWDESESTGS